MPSIARPQKVYDFTAHARRQPTAPPPGDRIDAQLQNHADAITAVQMAVERLEANLTKPIDVEGPARAILAHAERATQEIRRTSGDAAAIVDQAKLQLARMFAEADRAREAADRAEARLAAAVLEAQASPAPAPNFYPGQAMPSLGYGAGGPYAGDDAGAAAVSADYAEVAIKWAEWMPDTIPPNILAVNAISGDHWSSRWWANRSANAFGMLAWWYLGAWPDPGPPSTPNDPTGHPLPTGAVYFNTTHNQMMVWNGSAWIANAFSPAKNAVASLYYHATAGQTVFPLTTADLYGQSFAFNAAAPESVEVFVAGDRIERGLYTVNTTTSTVTFATGITPAGTSVIFDLLAPASEFAAGICLVNDIVPDGSTTIFHLTVRVDGRAVAATRSEELTVSVDGVVQEPVVAYTAAGDTITFSTAPASDSLVFIIWFGPVAAGAAGSPSNLVPLVEGVGAPGTSLLYARGDHVHPAASGGYTLPVASTTTLGGVKIDGTSVTIAGGVISASGASYTLPVATPSVLGGVKIDGSSITISSGVISATPTASYVLPTASTTVLGGVKVDGSSITIASGVISGASTYTLPAASITVRGGVRVDGTTVTISSGDVISAAGAVAVSAIAPSSPVAGSLWFDTNGGQMYVWYDDGNSQQWVPVVNQGSTPAPAAPYVPPPRAASWTQRNFFGGSTTLTDVANGVALFDKSTVAQTNTLAGATIPSPSTPYTIDACLTFSMILAVPASVKCGVGWSDGTKAQIFTTNFAQTTTTCSGVISVENYSAFSNLAAAAGNGSTTAQGSALFVRLTDDGTNFGIYFSNDGIFYTAFWLQAKSAGYLGASGYSNVGFWLNRGSMGPGGAGNVTLKSWYQH